MYKFYKINDEITGERSDQYFEPNEKYYIDDDGGRVENETYTEQNAANYERDKQINQVMYSGDPNQKQRLFDPSDEFYNYAFARQNGETKYDPTAEQLDQLYHDIDQGLISEKAKTSKFYLNRKQVKDRYPKKDWWN